MVGLLEAAKPKTARTVNGIMTMTCWEIGRRIVEYEQRGADRAKYGEGLIQRVPEDLSRQFGRGFGFVNVTQMRRFYLSWPPNSTVQTLSEQSIPAASPMAGKSIAKQRTPCRELTMQTGLAKGGIHWHDHSPRATNKQRSPRSRSSGGCSLTNLAH
ncbi:MAG: DUF1016 N-terminal domain-containing protein [Planctomycetota bacterium]|nr:DUF1016 N-terminal domain-containing protein [Planctomycetota bacterium]